LIGGAGNDQLSGSAWNNLLLGGVGNDILVGGTGSDRFRFTSIAESFDRINDFSTAADIIQLRADLFGGGLTAGVLKPDQFTIGVQATRASDRIIYNRTNGQLFFDIDGLGGQSQALLAILSSNLALIASNISSYVPIT
jgi:Ca2+-binding RTX toxin-like protein